MYIQGVASRYERRQLTDCWPEGSMHPEGPATAQLDQGYPCFSSVGNQIPRRTVLLLAMLTKTAPQRDRHCANTQPNAADALLHVHKGQLHFSTLYLTIRTSGHFLLALLSYPDLFFFFC